MQEGAKEAAASVRGEIDVALRRVAGPGSRRPTRISALNVVASCITCLAAAIALWAGRALKAIRGIGEKFAANPVTGTGSMSVPIATSPGRSGFGPQLSLSYDSGAGNGPFRLGWSLSFPSITRKTDKGLPQYFDGKDSPMSSSSPVLKTWCRFIGRILMDRGLPATLATSATRWILGTRGRLAACHSRRRIDGYRVRRYRPRIEGLFARIERWSKIGSPAMSIGARSPRTTSSPSTGSMPSRVLQIRLTQAASSAG
jgi:hypothetical protein